MISGSLPYNYTLMIRKPSSPTSKKLTVDFVGSFFKQSQLPNDRRPQIAVAGRSNVGKSSLLNKVFGQKNIAKVSSTPGKTRSLNFFLVNNKYHLVDLPGYGYAKVAKETKAGWGKLIEDYLTQEKKLIGLLLLLDCRRNPTPEDVQLLDWLRTRELPVLTVVTKSDKIGRDALKRKVAQIESDLGVGAISFSIVTGEGQNELAAAIRDLLHDHSHKQKAPAHG
ncbi:MAG: ribosome biogenesis GTP-binding protein YihA/YsxC [candidate division Zixibacteria bacterium]|nr:ribosome biogenesis GTP-binding protein YihA/YsxC [candidate division Zixibacteria bacterium]